MECVSRFEGPNPLREGLSQCHTSMRAGAFANKSAFVSLRRAKEAVEGRDELDEVVTPGAVRADSDGVGADAERTETASEPGFGDFGGQRWRAGG